MLLSATGPAGMRTRLSMQKRQTPARRCMRSQTDQSMCHFRAVQSQQGEYLLQEVTPSLTWSCWPERVATFVWHQEQ